MQPPSPESIQLGHVPPRPRPTIRGKFLFVGEEKFYVLAPGEHSLRVSAAGYLPEQRRLQLGFASRSQVQFVLQPMAAPAPPQPAPAPAARAPELPPRPMLTMARVTGSASMPRRRTARRLQLVAAGQQAVR